MLNRGKIDTKTLTYGILFVLFLYISNSNSIATGKVDLLNQDDVIVYAMPYDFDEYSAYTADSYATAQWNSAVYASLLKRSPVKHNWEPDLAANMPTISNDGLTFSFVLKENLTFSNGHILSTDDVKFSFHAALTPAINKNFYNNFLGYLDNDSISIIDSQTVEFTTFKSFAFARSLFSFPIVDEQYFEDRYNRCLEGVEDDCLWNDPDGDDVVSAGPFMVEDIDNVNEIVTVKANPYYYGAENIFSDKIIFLKINEKDAALSSLTGGVIDILDAQYVPAIDELTDIEGIREEYAGDPAHQELALNHLNPYFGTGEGIPGNEEASDQERYMDALQVREAMSHVVDREFAVERLLGGLGRPAATSMPEVSIGFDSSLIPREYSIETARTYMEAAGFNFSTLGQENEDKIFVNSFFEITFLRPSRGGGESRPHWDVQFVNDLPKIGIGVKEHIITGWGEIVPRTFGYGKSEEANPEFPLPPSHEDGGFDIFAVGYGWSLDWNPTGLYDSSGRCDTGDCGNFYNFDIEEKYSDVATLVRSYINELDFDARIQKVKILQQEIYDNIPVLPIIYPRSHWGFNFKIEGVDTLLLSRSAQDWANVKKSDFQKNEPTIPASSTSILQFPLNTTLLIGGLGLFVILFYNKNHRHNRSKYK